MGIMFPGQFDFGFDCGFDSDFDFDSKIVRRGLLPNLSLPQCPPLQGTYIQPSPMFRKRRWLIPPPVAPPILPSPYPRQGPLFHKSLPRHRGRFEQFDCWNCCKYKQDQARKAQSNFTKY